MDYFLGGTRLNSNSVEANFDSDEIKAIRCEDCKKVVIYVNFSFKFLCRKCQKIRKLKE